MNNVPRSRYVNAVPMNVYSTTSFDACGRACIADRACRSFNYSKDKGGGGGKKSCAMFVRDRKKLDRVPSMTTTAGYLVCHA